MSKTDSHKADLYVGYQIAVDQEKQFNELCLVPSRYRYCISLIKQLRLAALRVHGGQEMPPSKAAYREVDAVTIGDLSGIFMLGESSAVLRKTIPDLTGKRKSKVILNFQDGTSIDSAGVGELLAAYAAIKRIEGRVRMSNAPKKVCDMLELTQRSKISQVDADEPSALRRFD